MLSPGSSSARIYVAQWLEARAKNIETKNGRKIKKNGRTIRTDSQYAGKMITEMHNSKLPSNLSTKTL